LGAGDLLGVVDERGEAAGFVDGLRPEGECQRMVAPVLAGVFEEFSGGKKVTKADNTVIRPMTTTPGACMTAIVPSPR